MGKLIYTINDRGYVAIIEKASYSTNIGVLNPANPLVLCLRDDLLRYHPLPESSEEPPTINVRDTVQAHVTASLIDASVLNSLPV
jgi:hypothetical protein